MLIILDCHRKADRGIAAFLERQLIAAPAHSVRPPDLANFQCGGIESGDEPGEVAARAVILAAHPPRIGPQLVVAVGARTFRENPHVLVIDQPVRTA